MSKTELERFVGDVGNDVRLMEYTKEIKNV
ncbi:hypothetical protein ACVIRO_005415 [Rhizobium ruizarguesonis]